MVWIIKIETIEYPDATFDHIEENLNGHMEAAFTLPNTEVYKKAKALGFNDNSYLTEGVSYYTYEQSMKTHNLINTILIVITIFGKIILYS